MNNPPSLRYLMFAYQSQDLLPPSSYCNFHDKAHGILGRHWPSFGEIRTARRPLCATRAKQS